MCNEEFNLDFADALKEMHQGKIVQSNCISQLLYKIEESALFYSDNEYIKWRPNLNSVNIFFSEKFRIWKDCKKENGLGFLKSPTLSATSELHLAIKKEAIGLNNYFNFKDKAIENDWFKAINTFMMLKSHPLTVSTRTKGMENGWFVIKANPIFDDVFINWDKLIDAIDFLSPSFRTKQDAMAAIEDIGRKNIIHMFRTFGGIYD